MSNFHQYPRPGRIFPENSGGSPFLRPQSPLSIQQDMRAFLKVPQGKKQILKFSPLLGSKIFLSFRAGAGGWPPWENPAYPKRQKFQIEGTVIRKIACAGFKTVFSPGREKRPASLLGETGRFKRALAYWLRGCSIFPYRRPSGGERRRRRLRPPDIPGCRRR